MPGAVAGDGEGRGARARGWRCVMPEGALEAVGALMPGAVAGDGKDRGARARRACGAERVGDR